MKNSIIKSNALIRRVKPLASGEAGFTIIELMVAMLVASVVAMAGFALFHNSNWSYQAQEDVGEAQQNARFAMDRILGDLRTAGFGLPEPPFSLNFGVVGTDPSWITKIVSSDGGTNGTDSIAIVGIGYEAAKLEANGATDCNKRLQKVMCVSSLESFRRVTDKSFITSRKFISLDGIKFLELSEAQTGIANTTPPFKLDLKYGLDKTYVDGVGVYILHAVEYFIVTDTPTSSPPCTEEHPCLKSKDHSELRGSGRQLVAENIEDIQFAYNSTGTVYNDSPANGNEVSAIRVSIVSKARRKDKMGMKSRRPTLENHTSDGLFDDYRRRTLTRVVKIRN